MSRSRMVRWAGLFLSILWLAACSTPIQERSSTFADDPAPAAQTSGILATRAPSTDAVASEMPPEKTSPRADLEDFGPAPELENQVWLNTEEPLRLANLSGKVVLVDMWTFG